MHAANAEWYQHFVDVVAPNSQAACISEGSSKLYSTNTTRAF